MTASVQSVINNPENVANSGDLEMNWAMKAYEHAETYFNIICSVDPTLLKLTQNDDAIYSKFKKDFRCFKLDVLDEEQLKSAGAKVAWREFCEHFKDEVESHNFGTLIRLNCKEGYSDKNSIFGYRVQFLAIEIARNREGLNSDLRFTQKSNTREHTADT
ncbi:protein PBDC1-like [Gigantopelta aegis]|uniref:protein PBDC1-like n=1 Tax=Gigantopelta aegis TaxID=1735272 RepID=UPI001B88BE94|nr:protein PBDC1-like [Gigantopelta aegis]